MLNFIFKKIIIVSIILILSPHSLIYAAPDVVPKDNPGINNWSDNLKAGAESSDRYPSEQYGPQETNTKKIINYIGYILKLVALLWYLLIVRIVWAGYLWMTAGGEAEKVEDAKKVISHAVIGIIILVALYAISYFVVDALQKVSGYIG